MCNQSVEQVPASPNGSVRRLKNRDWPDRPRRCIDTSPFRSDTTKETRAWQVLPAATSWHVACYRSEEYWMSRNTKLLAARVSDQVWNGSWCQAEIVELTGKEHL